MSLWLFYNPLLVVYLLLVVVSCQVLVLERLWSWLLWPSHLIALFNNPSMIWRSYVTTTCELRWEGRSGGPISSARVPHLSQQIDLRTWRSVDTNQQEKSRFEGCRVFFVSSSLIKSLSQILQQPNVCGPIMHSFFFFFWLSAAHYHLSKVLDWTTTPSPHHHHHLFL